MSPEPTYLEKLESYLIDEFHIGLHRVMEGIWRDILHGDWHCELEFFKSFRAQLEHIMRFKEKPLQLPIYLENLNFSKKHGSQGGEAKAFAQSWIPIYRQRIFLFNALYLLLRERAAGSRNLSLVLSGIRDVLHQHILTIFAFLETEFNTGKFTALRSRIEPFIETRDKAAYLVKEMATSLQQFGFSRNEVDDWEKQRILFREYASEARLNEAFESWNTRRFYNILYLEIERLLDLLYLENLSHALGDKIMGLGIGDAFREGFKAMLDIQGQTIIVHDKFNTSEASSYEVRGLKNTEGKNSKQVVFQFLDQLDIQVGNVLQAKGSRDYWRVTDTEDIVTDDTFINFEVHVQKVNVAGQPTRPLPSAGTTYNLHGQHSRVNIGSQDSSVNISNQKTENVFADMRQVIQTHVGNEGERAQILNRLDELEHAKGKSSFTQKYQDFIASAADHISLLSPFIPALTKMLGG
jgi:hypothetical protein